MLASGKHAAQAAGGWLAEQVREHTPSALLPGVIWVRWRLAWLVPSVRADARRQMTFLLEHGRPGVDPAGLARGYVKEMARRGEVRWHPDVATNLRLEGVEHLLAATDLGRGVVLSFMHHGFYDRAFPSVARTGVPLDMLAHAYMFRDDAPRWLKQHVRLNSLDGGRPVSTDIGTSGILDLLGQGDVVAIASDVPGRTPVTFAGRRVLGSFGAARIAMDAGAPVIVMTSERDGGGAHVRLHPALLPDRFDSARSLLEAMFARHEAAVLAWPEATDLPLSRWGTATEAAQPTEVG